MRETMADRNNDPNLSSTEAPKGKKRNLFSRILSNVNSHLPVIHLPELFVGALIFSVWIKIENDKTISLKNETIETQKDIIEKKDELIGKQDEKIENQKETILLQKTASIRASVNQTVDSLYHSGVIGKISRAESASFINNQKSYLEASPDPNRPVSEMSFKTFDSTHTVFQRQMWTYMDKYKGKTDKGHVWTKLAPRAR